MSLILNIDTATEQASVCFAKEGIPIGTKVNGEQRDHAAWIQVAISELLKEAALTTHDLQAIAVTEGPGSYTGLRVGMATAKGLCYALQIPLITVSTLKAMAYGAKMQWLPLQAKHNQPVLLCPMIDARRMEVFTAVYNETLQEIVPPNALILDAFSFTNTLHDEWLICFGNGAAKWENISRYPNIIFINEKIDIAKSLAKLASNLYLEGIFADLAYAEPVYIKEFYSYTKK
jgi:tRNA threonylcarbamoyladenosine biosynthesis protein TsaB